MQTSEIVQRAIAFIEEHLNETIMLEQVADAAGMSVPHLYRLFYAMTGHPIKEYIRKRRTSEAAGHLRTSSLPTNEIGFRCGFDTYQTFIKTFKRFTGLTPGMYRQSGLFFSFERINLHERIDYQEEKDIAERYADIKVIRLEPLSGIGYLYRSEREGSLERSALERFRIVLTAAGFDASRMRLFGWNVEDAPAETAPSFGYQLLAVGNGDAACDLSKHPKLRPMELTGGLYATCLLQETADDADIFAAWNRLYAEWLPRSAFVHGEHRLFEEYVFTKGQLARMKLYLPVTRSKSMKTIEVVERPEVQVLSFRAEGRDCVAKADEDSIAWLTRSGLIGDERVQLLMSCSSGTPSDIAGYEVFIAAPDDYVLSAGDELRMAKLEGGLYARFITEEAYGLMSGVLEAIYRWLNTAEQYEPDAERTWYVHYLPDETAACYVPIAKTMKGRTDNESNARSNR